MAAERAELHEQPAAAVAQDLEPPAHLQRALQVGPREVRSVLRVARALPVALSAWEGAAAVGAALPERRALADLQRRPVAVAVQGRASPSATPRQQVEVSPRCSVQQRSEVASHRVVQAPRCQLGGRGRQTPKAAQAARLPFLSTAAQAQLDRLPQGAAVVAALPRPASSEAWEVEEVTV